MRIRTTLLMEEGKLRLAKAQAVKDGISLSDVVEKALDLYLPNAIAIVQPVENAPKEIKQKLDQAQELFAQYNAGTVQKETNE